MSSAAAEIVKYEKDVREGLRRIYRKQWQPVDLKTPLDELMAAEDGQLEEWSYKADVIKRMFEYFVQDGLEPCNVMQNVYAVAAHMHLEPWAHLTVRERGLILGDSHGAQHWRMQKICVNKVRRSGARSWKAPGQKSLEARGEYSEAQKGNTNRKKKRSLRHRRLRKKLNHHD